MARLKNDPVYNLMIHAASCGSDFSCLPAFVALLTSLDHWHKAELHDHHSYCYVFIQMFFNKENHGKDFTALQQSVYFDPQTLRKYWNIYRQNFVKEYEICRAQPQQLLIARFLHFLYDKELCKCIYPYCFLTLTTFFAFLSEANLSDPDRQFYQRLLEAVGAAKPFTNEELYYETAFANEE